MQMADFQSKPNGFLAPFVLLSFGSVLPLKRNELAVEFI
jgi:hypothetical protein